MRNLRRVRTLPWLLAVIITALSAGALAHALAVSVRAHRRELGVLRALGFTPHQNRATVGWQALCLAAAGIAIGVPAGIVVGRWGWTLLSDQIGIPATPDLPPTVIPIVVAVMTVLAITMAFWPSQRAARVQPRSRCAPSSPRWRAPGERCRVPRRRGGGSTTSTVWVATLAATHTVEDHGERWRR